MICPECQIGDIEYCVGGTPSTSEAKEANYYICDYCDKIYTIAQYGELLIKRSISEKENK